MASKINVVLLEDIAGVGKAGEIVSVAEGYARNSLFPSGQAAVATAHVARQHQAHQAKVQAGKDAALKQLQEKAALLEGSELTLTAKVKEGSSIYGSITKKDIAQKLSESVKLNLPEKHIKVKSPIKDLGSYDATLILSPEVECTIKVTIVPDPSSLPLNNHEE